eukprot:15932260-Heterocapsa_arctica.AAC.1
MRGARAEVPRPADDGTRRASRPGRVAVGLGRGAHRWRRHRRVARGPAPGARPPAVQRAAGCVGPHTTWEALVLLVAVRTWLPWIPGLRAE